MKHYCALIAAIIFLSGCTICRHKVLSDYAWAIEQGYQPEIVLYTATLATRISSLGIWNGHVQARTGDKWISDRGLSDRPEHPLGKYCWVMDLDQYIEYLYAYKRLSAEPYIERPEWSRCE